MGTESGVNPEALAAVVKELRREAAALRQAERCDHVSPLESKPRPHVFDSRVCSVHVRPRLITKRHQLLHERRSTILISTP